MHEIEIRLPSQQHIQKLPQNKSLSKYKAKNMHYLGKIIVNIYDFVLGKALDIKSTGNKNSDKLSIV